MKHDVISKELRTLTFGLTYGCWNYQQVPTIEKLPLKMIFSLYFPTILIGRGKIQNDFVHII